ncbi:MAG: amidohydrolase family protein [Treponema sp.]|nr:amidohydrolase family protein [Treponema sp.]
MEKQAQNRDSEIRKLERKEKTFYNGPVISSPHQLALNNFRIVDESQDFYGSVIVEDGMITEVLEGAARAAGALVIDGGGLLLMPALVDLHAHFREPGASEKETLESASLAAAAGGYGTVVCMANTDPVTDTLAQAAAIKQRCDALGLIDLYPALSLTRGMKGTALSEITLSGNGDVTRLFSEDGKDLADERLFLAAFAAARRAGVTVSCHCDRDGEDAATGRALRLAARAGARIHLAHVSTAAAADLVRRAKQRRNGSAAGNPVSCEITPHHLALTEADAAALGADSFGRVAPPLRSEADRRALAAAAAGGTVDAIATDHAPHTAADKARGAPGFSGLETAFAVSYTTLAAPEYSAGRDTGPVSLSRLSSLLSAAPARILGLGAAGPRGRGRIAPAYRADLCIADLDAAWTVEPAAFQSRGKNSPFAGRVLRGRIMMTLHRGAVVFQRGRA